jgi:integrase
LRAIFHIGICCDYKTLSRRSERFISLFLPALVAFRSPCHSAIRAVKIGLAIPRRRFLIAWPDFSADLDQLTPCRWSYAYSLLYGSCLRLMECVRLLVKDVDFGYARITVRDGKGAKDRVTTLPVNFGETP